MPGILLFALSLIPTSLLAQPLPTEVLMQNSFMLSAELYVPENYEDLPADAVFQLSKEDYETRCLPRTKALPVQLYRISYRSDDLKIAGLVALPKDLAAGQRLPLMVFNRGGNRDYSLVTACHLPMLVDRFGDNGNYALFMSQLRGSHGSEGQDEFGGADVNDVLRLLEIARDYPFVDPKNVFMAGQSRGGMMTYLALKHGAKVNAAVVLAGASDLMASERERPAMGELFNELIPGIQLDRAARLQERSALHWPERLKGTPLLILHGEKDEAVAFSQAAALSGVLKQKGIAHRFVNYPEEGHFFRGKFSEVKAEVKAWVEAHRK